MKVAYFSVHDFEKQFILNAAEAQGIELVLFETALSTESVSMASGFDAVCVFVNDNCSKQVVNQLSELGVKCIITRSAGYNHIDLLAAQENGIKVANVPEYSPYAVAEHTIALIMALNRKLIKAHHRIMDLNFSLNGLVGFDLHGKKVGVIGTGNIGSKVVGILAGFGCEVLAYDVDPDNELVSRFNVRYTDIETITKECDIITLHVPLSDGTRYIINGERIDQMKDKVMIINTSRGGLIDTKAVIKALKSKKVGYLGLDVYEEEQGLFFEDHSDEDALEDDLIARLMTFKNVLITSHQAFLTKTALTNIADTSIANLVAFRKGEALINELRVKN